MSYYPDDMNWRAYDAAFGPDVSFNTPEPYEIKDFAKEQAQLMAEKFAEQAKAIIGAKVDVNDLFLSLKDTFLDAVYDRLSAAEDERESASLPRSFKRKWGL